MSIATEIQRLQTAKADLKTAIEGKGVTVPSNTTLDGYANLVGQISSGGVVPPPDPSHDYSQDYLTFEALDEGVFGIIIGKDVPTSNLTSISYSLDNGTTWVKTNNVNSTEVKVTTPTVAKGGKVLWKGSGKSYTGLTTGTDVIEKFSIFFSNVSFNAYGNIQSLLLGDNFISNNPSFNDRFFGYLFSDSLIYDAENLIMPQVVKTKCYNYMFKSSTLKKAPNLPVTNLGSYTYCYAQMFYNCTALIKAPNLPATSLSNYCYQSMFEGCSNLRFPPQIAATACSDYCYNNMFNGCKYLETTPTLVINTLSSSCCSSMFRSCTNLKVVNITFNATDAKTSCFSSMFYYCTSLTSAPALPMTNLSTSSYYSMFYGCSSLTTAPALPATTLASNCYSAMFQNCTSLTTAPDLPATTLTTGCYQNMFNGCTLLNRITCLATNISASTCTSSWLYKVASSGTFTKAHDMESWTTGANGIPSGWTVYNASGGDGEPD